MLAMTHGFPHQSRTVWAALMKVTNVCAIAGYNRLYRDRQRPAASLRATAASLTVHAMRLPPSCAASTSLLSMIFQCP